MSCCTSGLPLTFRHLGRTELDVVSLLEFETEQVERFLGPLPEILAEIRRGPAHQLALIEQGGVLAGFYVIHPDRRDQSCWWLGWFAIDRRQQGAGLGRLAMAGIMAQLSQIPACRRVRLLVAPDNSPALRLYRRAGFAVAGLADATAELIMECALAAGRPSSEVPARFWAEAILIQVILARVCRMGVLPGAELHGEVAHPPPASGCLHS